MLDGLKRIAKYGKGSPRNRQMACAVHVALWPLLLVASAFWPARRRSRTISRILLIRIDGIGDLAMSSSSIRALRERYPDAQIDLITSDVAGQIAELLVDAKWINRVWIVPLYSRTFQQYKSIWRELRQNRYDVAVDLRGDLRNVMLIWLAGIPLRLGLPATGLEYLLSDLADLPEPHHQAAEVAELVRKLDVEPIDSWPRLPLRLVDLETADRWMDEHSLDRARPIVAFHLSASIQARVWPLERFVEVARRLRERTGAQLVVVGGKGEIEVAEEFARAVQAPVAIAAGQLRLAPTAALLSRCTVLIGNDSGPAHLAAYVGCSVVDLFSTANPACTRPLSPHAVIFTPIHPCDPRCDKTCARPETRCMLDHTVDAVADAAEKLIREVTAAHAG
jgi:lipopolysaccharide heptosyltransferase II